MTDETEEEVMSNEELESWGMYFLDRIETDFEFNHQDDGLWTAWNDGDFDTIMEWIESELDLTDQQMEWVRTALE